MTPFAARWPRLAAFADLASDRFNVILLRESRRALNGRAFAILFVVLLAVCLFAAAGVGLSSDEEEGLGWPIFKVLFSCFCGIAFLALPSMVSSMLSAEIKDRTFELLSITTVTPARILWGELATATGLFLLLASGIAPFMAFAYLLGGVDIRTIVTGMLYIYLVSMLLTILGILMAVVPGREIIGRLLNALLALSAWGLSSSLVVSHFYIPLVDMWDEPYIHEILLAILGCYLSLCAIFFTIGMARLSFPAANRSGPIRLAILFHILVVCAIAWFASEPKGWVACSLYCLSFLFLLAIALVGEPEELSQRQLRKGKLARRIAFLLAFFLPGASRGVAFITVTGILLCTGTTIRLLTNPSPRLSDGELIAPWVTLAYLLFFLAASDLFWRVLPQSLRTPVLRRVCLIVLFFLFSMAPLLVSLTADYSLRHSPIVAALHPFTYLFVLLDREEVAIPVIYPILAIGALALLVRSRWMLLGLLGGCRMPRATIRP